MQPEATSSPGTPVLEARGIEKRFGAVGAVSGVSLEVMAGRVTAILGPSGSGKSTLLRCLNFLEVPDAGEVLFQGRAVRARDRDLDSLRSRVGMVFQQFNLFPHLLVWENVALAPRAVRGLSRSASRDLALALLARVGLSDKADAHPTQLSGGQQQRAAIARALAMEPAALLFDEPTSALDPELTGEVLAVMRTLASEGSTMVVVTHEVEFARAVAHEVVFMDAGRVVERGTPSQVIDSPSGERARRFFGR
ncbi:MAG TPA: amino acid ABC transporter ATP-binding protein [Opitutaceae bacterium]|jgi:polar amino acid transport system ATP-binding protein|nr:amino acid ABC transporter ATP-binding protein [Opitutaceae bacterium]